MLNFHLKLTKAQRTELDRELVDARRAGDIPRVNRVLSILALTEGVAMSESARLDQDSSSPFQVPVGMFFQHHHQECNDGCNAKGSLKKNFTFYTPMHPARLCCESSEYPDSPAFSRLARRAL